MNASTYIRKAGLADEEAVWPLAWDLATSSVPERTAYFRKHLVAYEPASSFRAALGNNASVVMHCAYSSSNT
jgi:hypothetical protein